MAWLQVNFRSNALMNNVSFHVLIPAETPIFTLPRRRDDWRTVYLLHGTTGDATHWLLNTDVIALAQASDTCFILPSGGNSYYIDAPAAGSKYSQFIGQELVEFTRRLLPLSNNREDTILTGMSMGGYGAMYNGLKYHETFGHIIAMSSSSGINNALESTEAPNWLGYDRAFYRALFGDDETISKLNESEYNIPVLAKRVMDEAKLPIDLYMACGWNDFLVPGNRVIHAALDEMGFKHTYEEGPGTHEWPFWIKYLRRGLERIAPIPDISMKGTPLWVNDPRDAEN